MQRWERAKRLCGSFGCLCWVCKAEGKVWWDGLGSRAFFSDGRSVECELSIRNADGVGFAVRGVFVVAVCRISAHQMDFPLGSQFLDKVFLPLLNLLRCLCDLLVRCERIEHKRCARSQTGDQAALF